MLLTTNAHEHQHLIPPFQNLITCNYVEQRIPAMLQWTYYEW